MCIFYGTIRGEMKIPFHYYLKEKKVVAVHIITKIAPLLTKLQKYCIFLVNEHAFSIEKKKTHGDLRIYFPFLLLPQTI